MDRVVVGVKGASSACTMATAAQIACTTRAEIVAVHVMVSPFDVDEVPLGALLAHDYADAVAAMEGWCALFRSWAVPYRGEVVLGSVLPSLCAVAQRERATVLVLGRPRRSRLGVRAAARVVKQAPCRVSFVDGPESLVASADRSAVHLS